jgi:hypothetical protein
MPVPLQGRPVVMLRNALLRGQVAIVVVIRIGADVSLHVTERFRRE